MDALVDAVANVRKARDKVEAVRDVLPAVAPQLSLDDEGDTNFLQRLFEAAFPDQIMVMSKAGRSSVFWTALDSGGPLMSTFNEYAQYMELLERIVGEPVANWERPGNQYSAEVFEANNPLGTAFALLRKHKSLTDNVVASILEAAFPLAVTGLDEETRNSLFQLAADRGVTPIEIANAYIPLVEMLADVRFLEDEDAS